MECPDCEAEVGGVSISVGIVKVATFACSCGRHWRVRSLKGSLGLSDVAEGLDDLLRRYPGNRSEVVRQAISYLESKQVSMAQDSHGKPKALREKAADVWERRFLREAIGEDI